MQWLLSGHWLIWGLCAFCLLAALLPMWRVAHGAIRLFDFPRLFFASLSALGVILAVWVGYHDLVGLTALLASAIALSIQLFKIIPYTAFGTKQSEQVDNPDASEIVVTLLCCNVKQGNDNYQAVRDLIKETRPDIALFMEVNREWKEALQEKLQKFRNVKSQPQENSYGMVLATDLNLESFEIKFLLNDQVPSFHCSIRLKSGDSIRLIALHPEPPVPYSDTVGRDAEISMVGRLIKDEQQPVLVTGDLNDVAWSTTTDRFVRMTGLLDPRRGRGMYNSFHADYWFIRWPLDHLFHSRHFKLVHMERQRHVGSDHFPMLYKFMLDGSSGGIPGDDLAKDEKKKVDRIIAEEEKRDEDPVGTDWEK